MIQQDQLNIKFEIIKLGTGYIFSGFSIECVKIKIYLAIKSETSEDMRIYLNVYREVG